MNLVLEFLAVNGGATATGPSGVTGLQHEVWNYAVEDDIVIVATLGEGGEVFASLEIGSSGLICRPNV